MNDRNDAFHWAKIGTGNSIWIKSMKRTFAIILVALAAVALFGGLVYAVLVAAHISEPAANTVYGPTSRRLWATAVAVMAQIRPGFLIGGEVRYLRKYDGIGLEEFAGQALFVGPTAYLQLSERSRLTIAWSAQAWGRAAGSTAALDLVNFERHQARLIFGVNF